MRSFHRHVARITEAEKIAVGPGHNVRSIITPGQPEDTDPFLLLNEDWFSPGTFGDHPHRGFETVTLVLSGSLRHSDSRGNSGVLGPGDAQWMTAGRGIVHREEPAEGVVHSLQLWLNLPSANKMIEPSYQDLRASDMPVHREPGATLRVYSGTVGDAHAATRNVVPTIMVDIALESGATVTAHLPVQYNAFLYIIEGSGRFGETAAPARMAQTVWFSRRDEEGDSHITITTDEPMRAILWGAMPLREPVAAHGPFVMNSARELREAFDDYQAGRF